MKKWVTTRKLASSEGTSFPRDDNCDEEHWQTVVASEAEAGRFEMQMQLNGSTMNVSGHRKDKQCYKSHV